MIKHSTLNRILNVGPKEWPRIALAWGLSFFLRAGFVIGWTVTIAMFIHRIGIEYLLYLFVLNALLIMLGTIMFSYLIKVIKRPQLIVYTTLMAGSLLLLSTLFVYSNDAAFFGLIILAQSILLAQLNILITLFTEDLFSPLESQRTFPIIASSETLGGVLGGLTVGLLATSLPSYKFIYIWILAILLILPILLTSHSYSRRMPSIRIHQNQTHTRKTHFPVISEIASGIKKLKRIPFLRGMILVILLQFMLLNLLEFQYTKAIEETVAAKHQGITFEVTEYQPETNLQVSLMDAQMIRENNPSHLAFETELTQSLGLLQMIFSAGGLLVQLFLASRVISSLGIIGSLIIHPLVALLNLIGMTLRFDFFSAAIGRSSFEITGEVFNNAYHSSFYAIAENMRSQIKELMEGFVKPAGAIAAFTLFYAIQRIGGGAFENHAINITMVVIALFMALRLFKLQKNYTELSHNNLKLTNDLPTRLNAIEILGQNGHYSNNDALIRALKNRRESNNVKVKILETLGLRQDPRTIPEILDCLKDKNEEIRLAAIEALTQFDQLNQHIENQVFTRHRTIEIAKDLFQKEESTEIKEAIIHLLAKIEQQDIISFLIEVMETGDDGMKAACIKACGTFEDRSIASYLEKYLDHQNAQLRGQAIIALWQFKNLRKRLSHYLNQLIHSPKRKNTLASLHILGNIGKKKDLPYIIQHLTSSDEEVRHEAAKALAQLNHPASIPHIVKFMMHENKAIAHKTKKFVMKLEQSMIESIEQLVHLRISEYIHTILNESNITDLKNLDIETLERLKNAYATVDEHEEVYHLQKIIQSKEKKSPLSLTKTAHVATA